MNIRRYITKTVNGHWLLTLVNTDSGFKVTSDKHSTKHGALTEEDALMVEVRQQAKQDDLLQAFHELHRAGMNPTWVAGCYVIANVPGIRSLAGGKTSPFTSPEIVRSAADAHRLVLACS